MESAEFVIDLSDVFPKERGRGRSCHISRFTVMGIAPLVNSSVAISIGSTAPGGTSMTMGAPMLIWRARAPMIRAFSNRVYRMRGSLVRAAGGRVYEGRDGTAVAARNRYPYFNLVQPRHLLGPVWPSEPEKSAERPRSNVLGRALQSHGDERPRCSFLPKIIADEN